MQIKNFNRILYEICLIERYNYNSKNSISYNYYEGENVLPALFSFKYSILGEDIWKELNNKITDLEKRYEKDNLRINYFILDFIDRNYLKFEPIIKNKLNLSNKDIINSMNTYRQLILLKDPSNDVLFKLNHLEELKDKYEFISSCGKYNIELKINKNDL